MPADIIALFWSDISEGSERSLWSDFEFKLVCSSLPGARVVVISRVARMLPLRLTLTGFVQSRLNDALMIEVEKNVKCKM